MKLRIATENPSDPTPKKTMIRLAPMAAPSPPNPFVNPFNRGDSYASQAMNQQYLPSQNIEPDEPKIALKDPKGLKSGNFSKKHIEGIVKASKAVGIDPTQALALAWQESGFASSPPKKYRGRVINPSLAQIIDFEPAQEKELDERSKKTGIDPMYLKLAITLRDKLKYAKQLGFNDEASQLQAYNGYGVLTQKQVRGNKAYGVEIGNGIDMKKNPLYGKRLLELKQGFANNKEIADLINSQ